MRLLLVEDEADLCFLMKKGLKKKGYAVDVAMDGEEALFLYSVNKYDLIILDLNLPVIDGLEVLKRIRSKDLTIKIIIVSARSSIEDRILGLDLGANDYLVKPFDFNELDARIRTLLRMNFTQIPNILTIRGLTLDMKTKEVIFNEEQIKLTMKEYNILHYLMINKDTVLSKNRIIEHIWDNEADIYNNALKFHMHSLKKKLPLKYIVNIRGQGYVVKSNE
jgi:DNA-binding response OmpR family regulator